MDLTTARRIVTVDRLNNGIVVKFDDGRCVLYPCAFLYAKIAECKELDEAKPSW